MTFETAAKAESQLMRGFTTIQNFGGTVIDVNKAIDKWIASGPGIYSSEGFIK